MAGGPCPEAPGSDVRRRVTGVPLEARLMHTKEPKLWNGLYLAAPKADGSSNRKINHAGGFAAFWRAAEWREGRFL